MTVQIPLGYSPKLGAEQTQYAIKQLRRLFESRLEENLNLVRATAPRFLACGTGLQDNLNGVENPVSFEIKALGGKRVEVPHSLAKWKRADLAKKGYPVGKGIWTDMTAFRPDELVLDNTHSVYVDQWDWERVISKEQRTPEFLHEIVRRIYDAMLRTERRIEREFGIKPILPPEIRFVTTSEMEDVYMSPDRRERENNVAKQFGAVFIQEIGWPLKDGRPHDGRAPDYDDWKLNGDIFVWNPVLESALELSSMGIRVDTESLRVQLEHAGCMDRLGLEFHSMLMDGKLPLSIGGGIGQSRLSMFLLRKAHIGEVQSSIWSEETKRMCAEAGIPLL
jgi:aspartate--ammonia ligase